jgi:hypothetical protein
MDISGQFDFSSLIGFNYDYLKAVIKMLIKNQQDSQSRIKE